MLESLADGQLSACRFSGRPISGRTGQTTSSPMGTVDGPTGIGQIGDPNPFVQPSDGIDGRRVQLDSDFDETGPIVGNVHGDRGIDPTRRTP